MSGRTGGGSVPVSPLSLRDQLGPFHVHELDAGRPVDEPLDGGEDLAEAAVALGDRGDAERGPLPPVVVVDLGDRHPEPVTETVDDRPDRGALGLQGAALRDVELEAERGSVHVTIVPVATPDGARRGGRDGVRSVRGLEDGRSVPRRATLVVDRAEGAGTVER